MPIFVCCFRSRHSFIYIVFITIWNMGNNLLIEGIFYWKIFSRFCINPLPINIIFIIHDYSLDLLFKSDGKSNKNKIKTITDPTPRITVLIQVKISQPLIIYLLSFSINIPSKKPKNENGTVKYITYSCKISQLPKCNIYVSSTGSKVP